MQIVNFTPFPALLGSLFIGFAALIMLGFNGKIAGVSGITKGLLSQCPTWHERSWRLAFVTGLVAGGTLMVVATPYQTALVRSLPILQMALGGLLVGIGTAMGNGCTSGHGVCGLGRRSERSLASVITFIGTGMVAMYFLTHILQVGRL